MNDDTFAMAELGLLLVTHIFLKAIYCLLMNMKRNGWKVLFQRTTASICMQGWIVNRMLMFAYFVRDPFRSTHCPFLTKAKYPFPISCHSTILFFRCQPKYVQSEELSLVSFRLFLYLIQFLWLTVTFTQSTCSPGMETRSSSVWLTKKLSSKNQQKRKE